MPGMKDVVLASLIEKDAHENFGLIDSNTTRQEKLDDTQSLVPSELREQYDNEFIANLGG